MKYIFLLLVIVSAGLIFGLPLAHSHFTGLPVGVKKVNMSETKDNLPAGMTRVSNQKSNLPLPEGFRQLKTSHTRK